MRHLITEAGLEDRVVCDSAGTSSYHVGSAPDRRMAIAARRQGIELVGQSRKFTVTDFETYDRILAMDRLNYRDILVLDRSGKYTHKVAMMCSFCREHNLSDVPDPYYGGESGFNQVIDLLFDACAGLLDEIRSQEIRSEE